MTALIVFIIFCVASAIYVLSIRILVLEAAVRSLYTGVAGLEQKSVSGYTRV